MIKFPFVPAKAGTQCGKLLYLLFWIPAYAGMNGDLGGV